MRTNSRTRLVRLGVRECRAACRSRREVVETVEKCGGSVTHAMCRLGYPSHQTLHQWLNQHDISHEWKARRPWSRYDPELKARAISLVRSGMAGRDVVVMLRASSAAVVCNWVRAAEGPSPVAADRDPIAPMRDFEERAYSGLEGSLEAVRGTPSEGQRSMIHSDCG